MTLLHGKNYGRPTLDLNFAENKSLIDTVTGRNLITFSRSQSGKESTYVGSDGLIKYAGADEPRFDHDPETGESLGLLIEESRTNYITYSEDIGQWSKFVSNGNPLPIVSSGFTSPAGDSTAWRFQGNRSTGSGLVRIVAPVAALPNPHTVYYSVWLKSNTGSNQTIKLFLSTADLNATVTSEWQRFITGPRTNTSTSEYIALEISSTTSQDCDVLVWGAQLEVGSFPTSYIPTSGSTATRPVDEATITGTNFSGFYNQSEGSVFCDGASISDQNSSYWSIDQTATNNGATVLVYPQNTITFQVVDSTFQVNRTVFSGTVTDRKKTAVGLKQTNFASVINGGSVILDPSGSLPGNLNILRIGNYVDGGTSFDYSGTISRLTYWPKRLPDLELQQLTK